MSVEPIGKVIGPRSGIDGVAPLHAVGPVTRDPGREDQDGGRRRRKAAAPKPAAPAGVRRDDDGHVHVDVQA